MTTDCVELRRLSLAATQGPWSCNAEEMTHTDYRYMVLSSPKGNIVSNSYCKAASVGFDQGRKDFEYIAAANPTTVIELVDALEFYKTQIKNACEGSTITLDHPSGDPHKEGCTLMPSNFHHDGVWVTPRHLVDRFVHQSKTLELWGALDKRLADEANAKTAALAADCDRLAEENRQMKEQLEQAEAVLKRDGYTPVVGCYGPTWRPPVNHEMTDMWRRLLAAEAEREKWKSKGKE